MKICDLLLASGVKSSDTAVVYSALKGEEYDLSALLNELRAFFAQGNLVMPTGKHSACAVPNGIFDPEHTPSGEGLLSELFRCVPEIVRSKHPAFSLAALGNEALWLMEGHEKCASGFAPSSPWWKLFQKGTKCIFIGCGLESSGLIAAAEEWAGAARLSKRFYHRRLALGNGRNKRLKIKLHTEKHFLNYPKVEEMFRDAGILTRNRWDCCDVLVLDGSACVSALLRLLRRKPRLFATGTRYKNLKIS